jgi:hypothetical protein
MCIATYSPSVIGTVSVEAKAFDSGGLPGAQTFSKAIEVNNPGYGTLNIIVRFDNVPVQNAEVTIGSAEFETDTSGRASFSLPIDAWYTVDVDYRGDQKSVRMYFNENGKTEYVDLGFSTAFIISIALIVMIMIFGVILAIFLPIYNEYKIIIIIILIVVSIFVYIIMNGYLTI